MATSRLWRENHGRTGPKLCSPNFPSHRAPTTRTRFYIVRAATRNHTQNKVTQDSKSESWIGGNWREGQVKRAVLQQARKQTMSEIWLKIKDPMSAVLSLLLHRIQSQTKRYDKTDYTAVYSCVGAGFRSSSRRQFSYYSCAHDFITRGDLDGFGFIKAQHLHPLQRTLVVQKVLLRRS